MGSRPRRSAPSAPRILGALDAEDHLEWEGRVGRPAGIAATVAAACLLLGLLYSTLIGAEAKFSIYERSVQTNDSKDLVFVPSTLQFIGYVLFGFALYYLARATRARRPETPRVAIPMSVVGPVLKGIAAVLTGIALIGISSDVAALDLPPVDRAGGAPALLAGELNREVAAFEIREDNSILQARQIVVLAANLSLGFALVLVSLNAMRAGLLSRFIGILGIIAAVLTVLFEGAGLIEAFWLAAIGAIFMDRWPGGRGPAWDAGEAIPWPSAVDQRLAEQEAEQAEAAERADEDADDEPDEGEDEPEIDPVDDGEAPRPHPTAKKRKKKKRR